jgi:nitrogen regulatory protein PII
MNPIKRIEIFSDSFELGKILTGLKKAGVTNCTVIRHVSGSGVRGSMGDDIDMLLENDYVIAFCLPEQVEAVVKIIRPILNKFGGSCYVSDVMEVQTMNCVASK